VRAYVCAPRRLCASPTWQRAAAWANIKSSAVKSSAHLAARCWVKVERRKREEQVALLDIDAARRVVVDVEKERLKRHELLGPLIVARLQTQASG
jgi:hypothetical protein